MAEGTRELEDVLNRYRRILTALGINVERFYLFGSHRTGNAREDSDIDLIVVSPDFARLGFLERMQVLGIAAARILEPIEAQGFTAEEIDRGELTPFWKHVLQNQALEL